MTWFDSNETLIQSALIFTLLAYSFQVAMRAGVFSFAGVGFFAIGGYSSGILVMDHGWATVPAVAVGVLGSCVIATGLSLVLARLRALYLAMATVAFVLLVQVVATQWEGVTNGALGIYGVPVTVSTLGLVVIVALASLLLWFRERGASRRRLEVLRLDEQLAPTLGIDVVRRRHEAFVLSAALGALAGGLNILVLSTMSPEQVGFGLIVNALMMVVIGGFGTWVGGLVGAFIVTWLPDWLEFTGDWRPVVQGMVIVLMAVWVSDGLVGLIGRAWRRGRGMLRERRATAPQSGVIG